MHVSCDNYLWWARWAMIVANPICLNILSCVYTTHKKNILAYMLAVDKYDEFLKKK